MRQYAAPYRVRPKTLGLLKIGACLLGTLALGALAIYFSGAYLGYVGINIPASYPPLFARILIWAGIFSLFAASLYATIKHTTYTIKSQNLKTLCIILWTLGVMMQMLLPFLLLRFGAYVLSFLLCALSSAFLAAQFVLCQKLTFSAALPLLPILLWTLFETYQTLMIALNNF